MGKWAEKEYERVLHQKIKHLFMSKYHFKRMSSLTPKDMSGNEIDFQHFIEALDVSDQLVRDGFKILDSGTKCKPRRRQKLAATISFPPEGIAPGTSFRTQGIPPIRDDPTLYSHDQPIRRRWYSPAFEGSDNSDDDDHIAFASEANTAEAVEGETEAQIYSAAVRRSQRIQRDREATEPIPIPRPNEAVSSSAATSYPNLSRRRRYAMRREQGNRDTRRDGMILDWDSEELRASVPYVMPPFNPRRTLSRAIGEESAEQLETEAYQLFWREAGGVPGEAAESSEATTGHIDFSVPPRYASQTPSLFFGADRPPVLAQTPLFLPVESDAGESVVSTTGVETTLPASNVEVSTTSAPDERIDAAPVRRIASLPLRRLYRQSTHPIRPPPTPPSIGSSDSNTEQTPRPINSNRPTTAPNDPSVVTTTIGPHRSAESYESYMETVYRVRRDRPISPSASEYTSFSSSTSPPTTTSDSWLGIYCVMISTIRTLIPKFAQEINPAPPLRNAQGHALPDYTRHTRMMKDLHQLSTTIQMTRTASSSFSENSPILPDPLPPTICHNLQLQHDMFIFPNVSDPLLVTGAEEDEISRAVVEFYKAIEREGLHVRLREGFRIKLSDAQLELLAQYVWDLTGSITSLLPDAVARVFST